MVSFVKVLISARIRSGVWFGTEGWETRLRLRDATTLWCIPERSQGILQLGKTVTVDCKAKKGDSATPGDSCGILQLDGSWASNRYVHVILSSDSFQATRGRFGS